MTAARAFRFALGFALAAVVACCASAAEASNREADSVLKADRARLDAMLAGDAAALEEALAEDCLYVHSYGATQDKREFIDAFRKGTLSYRMLEYIGTPKVRMFGRDAAIITGRMQLEVVGADGRAVKPVLLLTAVYVRKRGFWKLASYQSTPAPAAAAP